MNAEISSGAVTNSQGLTTDMLTLKGSSGAVLKVSVNKKILVQSNSKAQLNYKGEAAIEKKRLSSACSIRKI